MPIIALDFETYYTQDYSLSKMSTEAYIRDPRFEVICVSVARNGKPAVWYGRDEAASVLGSIDWSTHSLLAYNTAFDGAILAWHYGHYPALYLDAMGMAKALGKTYRGASLGKVAELLNAGVKGDEVIRAIGKRYEDFAPHELQTYGLYCCNDTDTTVNIYKQLAPDFPDSEVKIQDQNLRLFIEPLLRFDTDVLHGHLHNVLQEKQEKIFAVAGALDIDTTEDSWEAVLKTKLSSNPQFAEVLQSFGIDPPVKISPRTGLPTWAFAKTDPAFLALQESEDSAVQALVAARLGVRSTIEQTRAESFINAASRGPWPVQYLYYGGHPGRFSGAGGLNPQNLRRGGLLRDSILPPPGHDLITADLKQIECRMVNYLAGQDDVIEAFALHDLNPTANPDVYCIMAGKLYRRSITPKDVPERQAGKVAELALGFGGGWEAYKRGMFKESGIIVPEPEARNVVQVYRNSHSKVEALWAEAENALACMVRGVPFKLGRDGILGGDEPTKGIRLPNGLYLNYPELRQEWNPDTGYTEYKYTAAKKGRPERVTIYGAKLVQNLIEALARILLTDAWLRLSNQVRVVMHLHDELVFAVPTNEVERIKPVIYTEMVRRPVWGVDLPIECEIQSGKNYGEASR